MSGVPIATMPGCTFNPLLVFDSTEGRSDAEGIGFGVDRQDRGATTRRIPPIERFDLAFLDLAHLAT